RECLRKTTEKIVGLSTENLPQKVFQASQGHDLEEAARAGRINENLERSGIEAGKTTEPSCARTEISVRFPELQSRIIKVEAVGYFLYGQEATDFCVGRFSHAMFI